MNFLISNCIYCYEIRGGFIILVNDKLQIVPWKSLYYEGEYEVNMITDDKIHVKLKPYELQLLASNIEIQLMYEKELYVTFDQLHSVRLMNYSEQTSI